MQAKFFVFVSFFFLSLIFTEDKKVAYLSQKNPILMRGDFKKQLVLNILILKRSPDQKPVVRISLWNYLLLDPLIFARRPFQHHILSL